MYERERELTECTFRVFRVVYERERTLTECTFRVSRAESTRERGVLGRASNVSGRKERERATADGRGKRWGD